MAGCRAQRFTSVTTAMFACLQAKGSAAGVPIASSDGQGTAMGVTMRWNYDPAAEVLVIECLDAPFFVPCGTILTRITDLVEGCRPQSV